MRMGARILVVDDVEDTRELYRSYFEFRGVKVATAGDGQAALEQIAAAPPDVVIMDLAMPRMTGWQAIQSLKADARTRHIPVIALSGQSARTSALEAGADAYIEKPCLPDQLLNEALRLVR